MRAITYWICCLAAICGIAATSPATAENLRLHIDTYGRPMVEVSFETGQSALMVLDTAARRTALTNSFADTVSAKKHFRSTIRHFSSGGILTLPLASLETLSVFGKNVTRNILALHPDRATAQGLVGFDTMRGQIIKIDPGARQVTTFSNAGALVDAGWRMISGRPNRFMGILLTATYEGQKLDVLIASGSSHSLLDRRAANALYPGRDFRLFHGTEQVYLGLSGTPLHLDKLVLKGFKIGDWSLSNLEVSVASLPVKDATDFQDSKLLMLGTNALMRTPIAFDFRSQSIWVPPATAP